MIVVQLVTGDIAKVHEGVWRVENNPEVERVLNSPEMQPPNDGHYAPSEDARMAQHALKIWGGAWLSSDERSAPGLVY